MVKLNDAAIIVFLNKDAKEQKKSIKAGGFYK